MKKIIPLFIIIFIMVGCQDDDWAPYTHYTKDKEIELSGNILVVDDIKDELTKIACDIESDVKLEFAEYELTSLEEGSATFEFSKIIAGKNRCVVVTLYVDISNNTVYKIRYEEGHGKRVSASGWYDFDNHYVDIEKIYLDVINNDEFKKEVKEDYYIDISSYNHIVVNAFSNDGTTLFHFED